MYIRVRRMIWTEHRFEWLLLFTYSRFKGQLMLLNKEKCDKIDKVIALTETKPV